MTQASRDDVDRILANMNGILRLEPAWVGRDFLPPGRRLGLHPAEYELGERGSICERWLASTTHADNNLGPDDEGLSYLSVEGGPCICLRDVIALDPTAVMGAEYASTHHSLGRLAKLFDYGARLPYHIHPRLSEARLVGCNPKEEAYYFLTDVDLGPHPEAFFGVHPSLAERSDRDEVLLPYLVDWDSDLILRHSRAEYQVPGDGFHIPAGILHAPGTALTFELQEESDAMLMFQALNAGKIISKELLFKNVHAERRQKMGERAALEWIDWDANGDPYFYENHHIDNMIVDGSQQAHGHEEWLFGGTSKFSGKRLVVDGRATYRSADKGVYGVFAWRGQGIFGGVELRSGEPGLDELLVCHDRATRPLDIFNTGREQLILFKFFGPEINDYVPRVAQTCPAGQ
jgi:hypothetical protein